MLALLEFFWDAWPEGEPPPVVSATATAVAALSGGSGKSKEVDWIVDPAFEPRAPEEFWTVREQYLKRLKAEAERMVPHERVLEAIAQLDQGIPAVQAIAETVAERERSFRSAEAARTAAELNQLSETILGLTKKLEGQMQLREDEETALMLLLVI